MSARLRDDRAGDAGAMRMRRTVAAGRVEAVVDRADQFGMARRRCRNRSPRSERASPRASLRARAAAAASRPNTECRRRFSTAATV